MPETEKPRRSNYQYPPRKREVTVNINAETMHGFQVVAEALQEAGVGNYTVQKTGPQGVIKDIFPVTVKGELDPLTSITRESFAAARRTLEPATSPEYDTAFRAKVHELVGFERNKISNKNSQDKGKGVTK